MSLSLIQKNKSRLHFEESEEFLGKLRNCIDDVVTFNGKYENYCVGLVDIVNSTKITAKLSKEDVCKYYGVFLNAMSLIVKEYDGVVVKNIGDSLLYYFPEKPGEESLGPFKRCIKCGLAMRKYSEIINEKMRREKLPHVSYRISADYGTVMLAKSVNSECIDIFGPTVNICTKINRNAKPFGMVIGNDLYQIVKGVKEFEF